MKTILIGCTLFCALMLPPLDALACSSVTEGRLEDYYGDINGKYKIQMTLVFKADAVDGEYFYHSQRKDIALKGTKRGTESIVLDELDAAGKAVARFEGALTSDCDTIKGTWQKSGASEKLTFSLRMRGSHSGRLDDRYGIAGGGPDDVVHANATTFWQAVKMGDKKTVAATIAYPVRAQVKGKKRHFPNAKAFLASYDAIFTPAFREAVVNSVPHNMSADSQGIMLGDTGEVWLNHEGKVKAINN